MSSVQRSRIARENLLLSQSHLLKIFFLLMSYFSDEMFRHKICTMAFCFIFQVITRILRWDAKPIMSAFWTLWVDPCTPPHSYAQTEPSFSNKFSTVTGGTYYTVIDQCRRKVRKSRGHQRNRRPFKRKLSPTLLDQGVLCWHNIGMAGNGQKLVKRDILRILLN